MATAASDGLRKTMLTSFGVHIAVVTVLLAMPRDWFKRETALQIPMTLAMGSPGEKTGGLNAAGAQPIEDVAPPPKRPAPQQSVTPPKAEDTIPIPAKTPPKTPPKPVETPAPPAPLRPPVTGAQVTPGTAVAATGSTGQSTGLSVGGGAGGTTAQMDASFCCPEYAKEVLRRIEARWRKDGAGEAGEITVVFEIFRNGTFSKPQIEKTNGNVMLELASRQPFDGLVLLPLPEKYSGDSLKIHMIFPYKR